MAALSPPTGAAAPQCDGLHKLSEIDASLPSGAGTDYGLGMPATKNNPADALDGSC